MLLLQRQKTKSFFFASNLSQTQKVDHELIQMNHQRQLQKSAKTLREEDDALRLVGSGRFGQGLPKCLPGMGALVSTWGE